MAPLTELPADHDLDHLVRALTYCDRFRVAVDGGAHTGIWTRRLAAQFETVWAFEPVRENASQIDAGGVHVIPKALGQASGRATMVPGAENTGQWHLQPGVGPTEVVALDTYRLHSVDLLKLDVEGYELQALQGARDTILRCEPVVVIEQNGLCQRYGVPEGAAGEWLEAQDYRRVERLNKDEVWVPS